MIGTGPAAAVLAPVFGSATAHGRALLEHDAAVRAPLPVCRRIGFVQLDVRSGASTTAAAVLTVLARRRAGMVLGVDASPSPDGLLAHLGPPAGGEASPPTGPATGPVGDARAVRDRAGTAAEACAGLPRTAGGCYGLDLRPDRPGGVPADAWSAAVGPIARFYDVVVTDWGLRHPAYDLEPVLTSSHAVCLTIRAEDAAVGAAAALLHQLPHRPPVVVALVALDPTARPARLARRIPAPVVLLRPEPRRAVRLPTGPTEPEPRRGAGPGPVVPIGSGPRQVVRLAHVRLAATLLRASATAEGVHRDR